MQTQTYSKTPRIIAGICFILYVLSDYITDIVYNLSYCDISLRSFLPLPQQIMYTILILMGIFIISGKKLPVTICIWMYILCKLVYPFLFHYSIFDYFVGYSIPDFLCNYCCWLLLFSLLTYSVLAMVNPRMKFLKLWFIPAIPAFFYLVFIFWLYLAWYSGLSYPIIRFIVLAIFSAGAILYFISLAQVAKSAVSKNDAPVAPPPVAPRVEPPRVAPRVAPPQNYVAPASEPLPAYEYAQPADAAAELRKYKALLDEGLISEKDYNIKKSQLLKL